jgi:hypothetical protein
MESNIKRIFDFTAVANKYQEKHPEETKLLHSIKRVLPSAQACIAEYRELQEDIDIEFANTDEHGSILFTIGSNGLREYKFKKESLKQRDEASKKLLNEHQFKVDEHISAELPESFREEYRQYFTGFVID